MPHRRWKLDIYARGVSATTGTISYTIGSSHFRDAPTVGGQIVRVPRSEVESIPWRVSIVDVGSTFTAKLATGGRMHLLGRMCRIRTALNSTAATAFTSVTVGRLTDLALSEDIASYHLDIQDERWVERQTSIFARANTVSIVPYGNIDGFQGVPGTVPQKWRVINIINNLVCVRYDGTLPVPSNPGIARLIVEDVKPGVLVGNTSITAGNFRTLRWKNLGSGTEYEIAAFANEGFFAGTVRPRYPSDNPYGWWNDPLLGAVGERDTPQEKLYVWLVWPTSQPSLDADLRGYLYAPTHEPTEDLPHLIGGSSGLHPFAFVRQIYAGTHSPTTTLTVRYSTAAFNALENEPLYGRLWYRATAPETMASFLNERIYAPYSVAPMVDSSGKIAPARMWLPRSTDVNVAGLPAITSTNALRHPTFEHPSMDIVNVVRYTREEYVNWFTWPGQSQIFLPRPSTYSTEYRHDNTSLFGRREQAYRLCGVTTPAELRLTTDSHIGLPMYGQTLLQRMAHSVFERLGDGPLYSETECSSSIEATTYGALMPGKFVKLRLATFPNAGTLARGSTRLMQVVQRQVTPVGRQYRLCDVGSNLNTLATPTVTLALSSMSSRHAIVGTVANLATGARYEAQVAPSSSTGSTGAPSSTSGRWRVGAQGTSTGLVWTLGAQPSQTRIFTRVRASAPGRIGSGWSTANVSVVTASIAPPTGLAVSSITAGSVMLEWTNGSSVYGSEILLDATSGATLTSTNSVTTVPPQTTRFKVLGLNANDGHKVGVRHLDQFGGRSAQDTTTFTTTTSYTAAPSLRGMVIIEGSA